MPDNPRVAVICGSRSDLPTLKGCFDVLDSYGIAWEASVISAHRQPEALRDYVATAEGRGIQVFVGAAGLAAHLPGVLASMTARPVIGVPLDGGALGGADALYAIVQMPPGVPVAAVAIGSAGAKNAGHLAARDPGAGRRSSRRAGPGLPRGAGWRAGPSWPSTPRILPRDRSLRPAGAARALLRASRLELWLRIELLAVEALA